ncbi:MAG: hypothetical protein RIQ68_1547, partial [Pseudomonadota bacterium]
GRKRRVQRGLAALPSLFRFLFVIGIIAGLAYGAMLALVTFVEPEQREMTQSVPAQKLTGK